MFSSSVLRGLAGETYMRIKQVVGYEALHHEDGMKPEVTEPCWSNSFKFLGWKPLPWKSLASSAEILYMCLKTPIYLRTPLHQTTICNSADTPNIQWIIIVPSRRISSCLKSCCIFHFRNVTSSPNSVTASIIFKVDIGYILFESSIVLFCFLSVKSLTYSYTCSYPITLSLLECSWTVTLMVLVMFFSPAACWASSTPFWLLSSSSLPSAFFPVQNEFALPVLGVCPKSSPFWLCNS